MSTKQFTNQGDNLTMKLRNVVTYNNADDKCYTSLYPNDFAKYDLCVGIPTEDYEDFYDEQIRTLHNSWGSDMDKYIIERTLNGVPHTILKLETKHKADWSVPKIWDSKLQLITERIMIRSGSLLNVSVNFRATEYQGTRFMQQQIKGVQVIKLAEGGYDSPFEEVDGGFVAEVTQDVDVPSEAQF